MFRPVRPSSGEFVTKIKKAIQIKTGNTTTFIIKKFCFLKNCYMFRPVRPSSGEFVTKIKKAIQIETGKTVQNRG
jgi:hypothetical protein